MLANEVKNPPDVRRIEKYLFFFSRLVAGFPRGAARATRAARAPASAAAAGAGALSTNAAAHREKQDCGDDCKNDIIQRMHLKQSSDQIGRICDNPCHRALQDDHADRRPAGLELFAYGRNRGHARRVQQRKEQKTHGGERRKEVW